MRNLTRAALVLGLITLGSAIPSRAATITLTFDGLQNLEQILDYYDGGTGGFGSGPGPDYGITFGADARATIEGNFSGNPSPPGILFFFGDAAIMNVAAGFDTGFSFYYSAANLAGSVTVYDGLDGTGNVLTTLDLPVTPTLPGGAIYDNWVPIGVLFDGIARSVSFSGTENQIGFDNITLGSDTPTPVVPEPSSIVLAGLGGLGLLARRGRRRA